MARLGLPHRLRKDYFIILTPHGSWRLYYDIYQFYHDRNILGITAAMG